MSTRAGAPSTTSAREEPIRAELFGIERLEQHAESPAAAEQTTRRPTKGRSLVTRVRASERVLLDAYHDVVQAVAEKREITLAEAQASA